MLHLRYLVGRTEIREDGSPIFAKWETIHIVGTLSEVATMLDTVTVGDNQRAGFIDLEVPNGLSLR